VSFARPRPTLYVRLVRHADPGQAVLPAVVVVTLAPSYTLASLRRVIDYAIEERSEVCLRTPTGEPLYLFPPDWSTITVLDDSL
jgi:hypothetical protein